MGDHNIYFYLVLSDDESNKVQVEKVFLLGNIFKVSVEKMILKL
jgi:hypothetical protein